MKVFIIIDEFRPIINETIYQELKEQAIEDTFMVVGVHNPTSVINSIAQSHKQIVNLAKVNKFPEVCILEEDVMFLASGAWKYFLANKPADYDLYLGGCYGLNQEAYKRIAEEPGAIRINNFAGLHCYCIHERYYDRFLSLPEDKHIDDQPGLGIFYVCSPFIALQHPGWSSNCRDKVNYNKRLIKEVPHETLISWEKINGNP